MANINGKSYALTAFTRSRPSQTWKMRLSFAAVYYALRPVPRWYRPIAMRIPILGELRRVQLNLTDLSFIHFARWTIITRDQFPHLDPAQPRETLSYDYMYFESNFNGDWEKYIAAFSEVIPGGMDGIWRFSEKYPGSRPITPFLAYIRNCQYDTDYYYNATPGAATNDIRGALRLQTEFDELAGRAAGMTPVEFAEAYHQFCIRIQNCLGTTGTESTAAARPRISAREAVLPSASRTPATA